MLLLKLTFTNCKFVSMKTDRCWVYGVTIRLKKKEKLTENNIQQFVFHCCFIEYSTSHLTVVMVKKSSSFSDEEIV